jgi:hypothetical protein
MFAPAPLGTITIYSDRSSSTSNSAARPPFADAYPSTVIFAGTTSDLCNGAAEVDPDGVRIDDASIGFGLVGPPAVLQGSFTKSVRRVKLDSELDKVRALPLLSTEISVGNFVTLAPQRYEDSPKAISRLQVSRLDLSRADGAVGGSASRPPRCLRSQ